jgi:Papain-like cysteine protease AvrRpt2
VDSSLKSRPSGARRRRRFWLVAVALVGVLVCGAAAYGAVRTNTFGAGDKLDRLFAKIERFLVGPPPSDRPTKPTVVITPPPSIAPTATPTLAVGATPPPPTPTPTPLVRTPVDVSIVKDPKAVFAHEIKVSWCAPAGVEMVLATLALVDATNDQQREIASRIHEWETYEDSHNYDWGPAAMASALEAYGAPGYEVRAYESRGDALRGAAVAIQKTAAPVILLAWKGAHTWVMTGFRADADPSLFDNVHIAGTYILDPWYPDNSSIWGQSDPPGTFQDDSEMKRNFLAWDRPEGAYPGRDGKFIVIVPTIPVTALR